MTHNAPAATAEVAAHLEAPPMQLPPATGTNSRIPRRRTRTKADILTILGERPMTASELGRKLSINRSAVLRHLRTLAERKVVERLPSRRKWVYYRLPLPPEGPNGHDTSPEQRDPPGR